VKAFLLAAGVGERLKPITDTTPKCMVEIDGQPMLDIWLDELHRAGVDEVLVNTHHLAHVVTEHVASRTGPPIVRLAFEPSLLGSAGTLAANRDWLAGEEFFLACNADNLTDFDLGQLIDAHRGSELVATIAVFHSETPWTGGVVELGSGDLVTGFVEKPANPVSDLVNAGIYAFDVGILEEISGPPPVDIGYHLLPRLPGRAKAVRVAGYFRDIGTPEAYKKAGEEWPARARQP
jgi:mannose-1-phosphate guanylyltransferase